MSEPELILGVKNAMLRLDDDSHLIGVYSPAGTGMNVFDVTFTLVTGSYASGTVIAATQEISNFFLENGGSAIIAGFDLLDEEAQNVAMTLLFLDSNVSVGNEHSPYSISDANSEKLLGRGIEIGTTDYKTFGNNGFSKATYKIIDSNVYIPYVVKAAVGSRSLYVALINGSGAPIWTGNKLLGKIAVMY